MYDLVIEEKAFRELAGFRASEQRLILDSIDQQLPAEPMTETRNRKPLRLNELASWELRVGRFRVFYDIDAATNTVRVKAIGAKEGNRLLIGGEEFEL